MSQSQAFTPGSCAVVTAASGAATITAPTIGLVSNVMIQVAAGANAAFCFTGSTSEAPDGTPDQKAITVLGGSIVVFATTATTISYIRVGGSDATVYLTWGYGD